MAFPLALAVSNGTLVGAACVVFIIVAILWLLGVRR